MAGKSKYAEYRPRVEEFLRIGLKNSNNPAELRSQLSQEFPKVPGATMTGWYKKFMEKWQADQNRPRELEAIAVNVEAVEMPDGKVVNLKDYQDGHLTSQKRHKPKVQYGVSHFYAVVDMAREVVEESGNDYARIAAGQLMLRCLYAESELPRHILDGTTTSEIAEESKKLEELSVDELNKRYQERLGNL